MKFSCERCGKRYATAEPPAPNRVYRIKCRACGHLIVLRIGDAPPAPTPAPSNGAPAKAAQHVGAATEEVSAGAISRPAAVDEQRTPREAREPLPRRAPEQPAALAPGSASDPMREPTPAPLRAAPEPTAPPAGGYVDLFAEAPGPQPAQGDDAREDDPFLAAASASLRETHDAGDSTSPPGARPAEEPDPDPASAATPSVPLPVAEAKAVPKRKGTGRIVAVVAALVLVLAGAAAFLLLGR